MVAKSSLCRVHEEIPNWTPRQSPWCATQIAIFQKMNQRLDPNGWAPGISNLTLQDATKNVELQYFGAASQLDAGFGRHSKNMASQLLGSNIGGGLYPITDGKADSIEENEYVEYGELEADPPRADREPSQGNPTGGKPGGNNFSGAKFQDGLLLEVPHIPTCGIKNISGQDTNDLKSNAM
jgi:hypothetical protein